MQTKWRVSNVVVSGSSATAVIRGSNTVRNARGGVSEEPVNLRARLIRTAAGWRLTALVN
jgi:hypothetical protein